MVSAAPAAAGVSSPAALAAGVEGSDGQLWAQAPPQGSGWLQLGGRIIAPPAVAAPASAGSSTPADPLFIGTGTDGSLWIRSLTDGWQPVGAAWCTGGPGAVITGSTLTLACRGLDNALWYTTTTVPASGLPTFTGPWISLGGILSAGPAVAPVGGTVTFFVRGSNGQVFTRTASAGYAAMPWFCNGSPAAAQTPAGGLTTFGCQGTDHGLWEATSSGAGWSPAVSLGGVLIGGPAVAATSQQTDFLVEGTDGSVWQHTPAGWTSVVILQYPDGAPAGGVVGGVGAVSLNMPAGAPWGNPIQISGPALGTGTAFGSVGSLSCPSAGNCTGGGSYTVVPCFSPCTYAPEALVVSEVNGTWGDAVEVPGTAALNTGKAAGVSSVSCPSAGNCGVGGGYADSAGNDHAFVADEVSGTWRNAIEVPGTASLGFGARSPFAYVYSVSCGSASNCAAVGTYTDSSGNSQAFVADEVNGSWENAMEVPGTAGLNAGSAGGRSVSCPSAGNCAAVGTYTDSSGHSQAFVADEVNGSWENASEVPGTAALNTGSMSALVSQTDSVSCGSAGNCAIGGDYIDSSGHTQAFVADQVNGTWRNAIEVPGTAALNSGNAYVLSVSCPSAGNCSAGGEYSVTYPASGAPSSEPFVVSEVNGTWGDAIEVPGTSLSAQLPDLVSSVSCGSPGNCAAGGYYEDSSGYDHAFVVSQVNGTWGEAIQILGLTIGEYVNSVSCPPASSCTAGGFGGSGAFVISQS